MKFNKVVSVLASAAMAASLLAAPAFAGETEASTEAGTEAEGDLIGAKGTSDRSEGDAVQDRGCPEDDQHRMVPENAGWCRRIQ